MFFLIRPTGIYRGVTFAHPTIDHTRLQSDAHPIDHTGLQSGNRWRLVSATESSTQYVFDNTKTRLDGPITLDVNPSTSAFSLHNGQKPLELSTWGFPTTLSAATIPAISGFLAVVRPCVWALEGEPQNFSG